MKLVPRTKPIDADDNIGRGMDFALVILVFLGIGWAIDRALDTRPAFMIGCTVFAVVGQFVRMWYAYDARMSQLEAERSTELRSRHPRQRGRRGPVLRTARDPDRDRPRRAIDEPTRHARRHAGSDRMSDARIAVRADAHPRRRPGARGHDLQGHDQARA